MLKEYHGGKKFESLSKDELRKEKNTLMQQLLQEKSVCDVLPFIDILLTVVNLVVSSFFLIFDEIVTNSQ